MLPKIFPAGRFVSTLIFLFFITGMTTPSAATSPTENSGSTTNHKKHAVLQQDFSAPQEVIRACLSCHSEAADQIHKTIHWTWRHPEDPEGKHGKGGISFNNFCIAIPTNEPRCTSCHIGFGWKDSNFDFFSQENVDCLACHDRSGTYKKFPTSAGYPPKETIEFEGVAYSPPDYRLIAASVGRPGRDNCGACHFYGGGGDAVKHGDLDSSLSAPTRRLDVHLSPDGADFTCQRCHTTRAHVIAGRSYYTPAFTSRTSLTQDDLASRIVCESCHTATPHKAGHKANDHTDKVSCQACHIPAFARELPTKVSWDWSTAGKKKDGKPYVEKGEHGMNIYDSKKGDFVWEKTVRPLYRWYAGAMEHLLLSDTADISQPVEITRIVGGPSDPNSRIMPFKAHTGKQPFDIKNKTFVAPHLFGNDDTAYWKNYDWQKAIETGQKAIGLPFSGEFTFVDTVYYYPITHMVAPKEDAVPCGSCHARDSRLTGVAGVWMPGRDSNGLIDGLGWLLVLSTLGGAAAHGTMRWLAGRKRK
ncbi:tetrathionate reductase family octaheme c-type cytochrome [Desulfovibrio sp. OttesenSCG-928-M16]|nr:tetrathionate reductase family octaheme c-type cytochrome [Desulfovibrio sp. OttesenSCG-928-M16]